MADVYVVQHAFQGESGLAKDEFVNTFHFDKAAAATGTFADLANFVKNLYWTAPAGVIVPMGTYLSHTINSFPATVKIYRLSDAKPRPEVYFESYSLSALVDPASTQDVPYEVACCLSYNAAPIAGVPAGRLRGRVYYGPWNGAALGVDGRPLSSLLTQMRTAGKSMCNFAAAVGWHWGVFSPTRTAAAGGVQQIAPIVAFSTDDAWDTQRRRGNAPTQRVSLTV